MRCLAERRNKNLFVGSLTCNQNTDGEKNQNQLRSIAAAQQEMNAIITFNMFYVNIYK